MNEKTKGAMLILSAILISSTLTYLLTKAKYQKQPISIKPETKPAEPVENKKSEETAEPNAQTDKEIDVIEYAKKLQRKNSELTRDYTPDPEDHKERDIIDVDIFESDPEHFDSVTYTLWADGTLTDEVGDIIYDPESTVGRDTIERFNALEHNGAVYVRNYKLMMDYEILRGLKSYKEAHGGQQNGRSGK